MNKKLLISTAFAVVTLVGCGGDDSGDNDSTPIPVNQNGTISISGAAIVGETLTVSVTDANGVPSTVNYEWSTGATTSEYTIVAADAADEISVTVSYTDNDGYAESLEAETDTVTLADVAGAVSIEGQAAVGETLTAVVTDDDGLDSATITYQWATASADIAGATSGTYLVTSAELGETITVTATYTDDRGFAGNVTSDATPAVTDVPADIPGVVTISGIPVVGNTLTAAVTDANGVDGATFTYQWATSTADISGATSSTYVLTVAEEGETITVTSTYTDDDGYASNVTSDPTDAVDGEATDFPGTVAISGTVEVGETLTAAVTDDNGTTTSTISYQWDADGTDIAGATDQTFVTTATQLGAIIGVTVGYTDDDGFVAADLTDTVDTILVTTIVDSEATLLTALAAAVDGDVIGLDAAAGIGGTDDYASMAEITIGTDNVTLTRISDTAVISGETCIHLNATGATVDGLYFDEIDLLAGSACASNGPSSVYLNGTAVALRNSTFDGETRSVVADDPQHFVALRGYQGFIERNLFTGKDVNAEGSSITIYATETEDNAQENTIRYNVFKDMGVAGADGDRSSAAYAIQLGRSTGDADFDGINTISYNLFDSVRYDRRLIRTQSELNVIDHNTFLNTSGQVAFEDGANNTASNNIMINLDADNNDDGGFVFSPFGHTITNNYIAGIRETSGDRGPIMFVSDYFNGGANVDITPTAVTVANNTILNSREPLEYASKDCADAIAAGKQFIVDMDSNLVANGEDDGAEGQFAGFLSNGEGRTAIQNECAISTASDFDDNHIYSGTFASGSENDFYGDFAGASGNISGDEGEADVVANANGLLEGQGVDAGIGADVSVLELLDETMVGPGTTWTP